MKLGTFKLGDRVFCGVIQDDRVLELEPLTGLLSRAFRMRAGSLRDFLTNISDFSELAALLFTATVKGHRLNDLQTLSPIADPPKVICIGLNYRDHAEESQMAVPEEPVFFNKFTTSLIGDGQAIILPPVSRQVDYEAELAVVIGTAGKRIPLEQAMDHVAGYTILNDVSARDLQFRGGQWIKGKALDTFAPLGPWIVTADEISDPHQLPVKLWLNGQLMQDSDTRQLIFNIPQLIHYLSQLFTLEPGDIIATGTPPGVGFARKPPVFLKDGDKVRIEIDGIGTLNNPVVQEG